MAACFFDDLGGEHQLEIAGHGMLDERIGPARPSQARDQRFRKQIRWTKSNELPETKLLSSASLHTLQKVTDDLEKCLRLFYIGRMGTLL